MTFRQKESMSDTYKEPATEKVSKTATTINSKRVCRRAAARGSPGTGLVTLPKPTCRQGGACSADSPCLGA